MLRRSYGSFALSTEKCVGTVGIQDRKKSGLMRKDKPSMETTGRYYFSHNFIKTTE